MPSTIRVRTVAWAVTAAALAVVATVIVTQAWQVDAAPGDDDSTFVPTTPCRLFDTRPGDFNVGDRATPIGEDEAHPFQVTGTNGQCTIPVDAVAVSINVTGLEASASTFVTLYPSDAERPLAASLNVAPGQGPTPNKLDIKLSADGQMSAYNRFGTIHLVGDVVGYYTSSTLADISARLLALESQDAGNRLDTLESQDAGNRLDTLEAVDAGNRLDTLEAGQAFAVRSGSVASDAITPTASSVASVQVTAPVAGNVALFASAEMEEVTDNVFVRCGVNDSAAATDADESHDWVSGIDEEFAVTSATDVFAIGAGQTVTYHLVCQTFPGNVTAAIQAPQLTAVFTPG